MTTPDTTEAVCEAIVMLQEYFYLIDTENPTTLAKAVIEADRKALAEQGYVIVNRRDVRTAVEWLDEALIDSDMSEEVWDQVSESRNCLKKAL